MPELMARPSPSGLPMAYTESPGRMSAVPTNSKWLKAEVVRRVFSAVLDTLMTAISMAVS